VTASSTPSSTRAVRVWQAVLRPGRGGRVRDTPRRGPRGRHVPKGQPREMRSVSKPAVARRAPIPDRWAPCSRSTPASSSPRVSSWGERLLREQQLATRLQFIDAPWRSSASLGEAAIVIPGATWLGPRDPDRQELQGGRVAAGARARRPCAARRTSSSRSRAEICLCSARSLDFDKLRT
jgi:hypothetical protein